jgi:hypothetical protein
MPGPVLPHLPALVPLLPVRPKPTQPQLASPFVELAPGKGGARRRNRLELVPRPLDHGGVEPQAAHHPLGVALQPQALAIPATLSQSDAFRCGELRLIL